MSAIGVLLQPSQLDMADCENPFDFGKAFLSELA